MVGVVLSIGDDDMVEEVDAHELARAFDALGQFIVRLAGREIAGGVVVTDGEDGAVGEDGFTHDDADIDGRLRDAAM